MEFLVQIEIRLPPELPAAEREPLLAAERARGLELIAAGTLVRVWRIPGRLANVGIWSAADATELHAAISALPLYPWMDVTVTALATHPLENEAS